MAEVLTAVYQDGAFIPEQATSIAAGSRVRLVVEPLHTAVDQSAIDEFDAICDSIVVDGSLPRMTRDQLHERD
jgi:predicted DNA-binding antitoxin AbrB/MazE fold protein